MSKIILGFPGVKIRVQDETIDARKLDIAILEGLFLVAANQKRDVKEIYSCVHFTERLRDITENGIIDLDSKDLANLKAGIEVSASIGSRPLTWYGSGLWKQFCELPFPESKK